VKRFSVIASAVLVATLGSGLSCYVRDRIIDRRFDGIRAGMSEQQIIQKMGKPDSIGACGKIGGGFAAGCAKEYLYSGSNPLNLTTWAVFVDVNGRILDKYQYSSP